MNTQNKRIRWLYLAIGTAALLFAGIIYGWSVLKAPLAAEFGWTASALSLNFTFTMCFFCVGGIVGGVLSARLGFRLTCIISAILAGSGFALSAAMGDSIIVLYISYGLMGGLGIGMAYNAVISTVSMWFPDKKGLCSGVLMMGFGASTLILGKLADSIISTPEMGWRTAFRIIGIALGIVILIAGTIIKRPEQVGASKKAVPEDDGKSYTAVKMLKSAAFRKAFILLVFLVAVGNTVISMAKDLAISVGIAATAATTLVGVLSVCNGLGRVITGAVFDKYGRRTTHLGANLVHGFSRAVRRRSVPCGTVLRHLPHNQLRIHLRGIRPEAFRREFLDNELQSYLCFIHSHRLKPYILGNRWLWNLFHSPARSQHNRSFHKHRAEGLKGLMPTASQDA